MSGSPRTHSAGTAEIARRSGGDSMPVDDSYALESTLSRIRQRYALYFNLPAGVRAGEERAIEVTLADASMGRYRDAEVRYRRVYLAAANGSAAESPEITRAPVSAPAPESSSQNIPVRRRPAVNDASGPRQGPLEVGSPADRSSTAADDQPSQGGWRRAKPDDK